MKHKHFSSKIKDSTIDALDLLMHYVAVLDLGLQKALDTENMELYDSLSDKMLGASDRLTAIVMNFGEEEEDEQQLSEKRAIGFEFKDNTIPAESSEGIGAPNCEPG